MHRLPLYKLFIFLDLNQIPFLNNPHMLKMPTEWHNALSHPMHPQKSVRLPRPLSLPGAPIS